MSWLSGSSFNNGNGTSGFNNLFSGGSGNFGNSSSGFDWGSVWGDIGQSGSTYSNWSNILNSGSSSSSKSGGWLQAAGNLFGGGGKDSGNSNIWGAVLSGLGGAADAYMQKGATKEQIEATGREQRRTAGFAADLDDFYKQTDKARKRVALDTYGQFSLMSRWAPNATPAPPVQVPAKPTA